MMPEVEEVMVSMLDCSLQCKELCDACLGVECCGLAEYSHYDTTSLICVFYRCRRDDGGRKG